MKSVNHTRNPLDDRRVLTLVAALVLSLGAVACDSVGNTGSDDVGRRGTVTTTTTEPSSTATASTEPAIAEPTSYSEGDLAVELSEDELAGLLWIREEEQLAHDVYTTLGETWGLRIFDNIASSERTHVDAALSVLARYDIVDPAAENGLGTFTDAQIQDLYDQLVADGSASLNAALEVGALIEELDISDLRARAAATENSDLTTLYGRLERGSRNHLRAFTTQLHARDVVYEPTRSETAAFEEIVSSSTERGHPG